MSIKIKYSPRLVAFLDVMGFQEMLNGPKEILENFYNVLNEEITEKELFYQSAALADDFQKITISDSIILSVKFEGDDEEKMDVFRRFLNTIAIIKSRLASRANILIRGGISGGDLFIDQKKNLLVGPSYVQAYEMEGLSDYPRTIVDPRVCSLFENELTPHEFVTEINQITESSSVALLIPLRSNIRFDSSSFKANAIQLNWFLPALWSNTSLNSFFKDLRKRAALNQNIFQKMIKLFGYLKESEVLLTDNGSYPPLSGRRQELREFLEEQGY